MIAAVSSDLIQSEIALRTVSTQRHHPSRKMVDKGLEQVEQKNKVSQNLHNSTICRIVLGGDFSDFVTRWHPMGR